MAETITKDRKIYRIWDAVNKQWHRLNFLTNAKSVDADDGKNLQTKVGAINGITSDINGESESIAASIKCVNQINSNISNLKKSVSDGKSSIASAITAKGVTTAADATFATMAGNIKNIKTTTTPKSLGSWSGNNNINVKSLYSGYSALTVNNFVIEITNLNGVSCSGTHGSNASYFNAYADGSTPGKTYTASTGILTITGMSQTIRGYDEREKKTITTTQTYTYKVYIIA